MSRFGEGIESAVINQSTRQWGKSGSGILEEFQRQSFGEWAFSAFWNVFRRLLRDLLVGVFSYTPEWSGRPSGRSGFRSSSSFKNGRSFSGGGGSFGGGGASGGW